MNHAPQSGPIEFGFQEEWKHFQEQYPLFLDRFPNLKDALELAFSWTSEAAKPIEKFVQLRIIPLTKAAVGVSNETQVANKLSDESLGGDWRSPYDLYRRFPLSWRNCNVRRHAGEP